MHPNLRRMLEGFRAYDVAGLGVVNDDAFLTLVRHYSGEVPAVETLLDQFRSRSVTVQNGVPQRGVDYLAFVQHLDRLLSGAGGAGAPAPSPPEQPPVRAAEPAPQPPLPPKGFSQIAANTIMLHRQRSSPAKATPSSPSPSSAEALSSLEALQARSMHAAPQDRYEHLDDEAPSRAPSRLNFSAPMYSSASSARSGSQQRKPRYLTHLPEVQELLEPEDDRPMAVHRAAVRAHAEVPVAAGLGRDIGRDSRSLFETVSEKVHTSERRSRNAGQSFDTHTHVRLEQPQEQRQLPQQQQQHHHQQQHHQQQQQQQQDHQEQLQQQQQQEQQEQRQQHQHDACPGFSQDDLAALRSTYTSIDRNGDGLVTYDRLLEYLHNSRIDIDEASYEQILSSIDREGQGCLDFRQFCRFVELVMQHGVPVESRTLTEMDVSEITRTESRVLNDTAPVDVTSQLGAHEAPSPQCVQEHPQRTSPLKQRADQAGRVSIPPADPALCRELTAQAGVLLQLCNQQDATRNGYVPYSVLASLCSTRCSPRIRITKQAIGSIITGERNRKHLLEDSDPVVDYIDLVSALMRAETRGRRAVLPTPPPAQVSPVVVSPASHKSSTAEQRDSEVQKRPERRSSSSSRAPERRADASRQVGERRRRNRFVHTAMVKLLGQWDAARLVTQAVVSAALSQQGGSDRVRRSLSPRTHAMPQGYMKAQDLSRVISSLYKAQGQDPVRSVVTAALEIGKLPFLPADKVPGASDFESAAQRAAAALASTGIAQNSQSTPLVDYRFFLAETKLFAPQVVDAAERGESVRPQTERRRQRAASPSQPRRRESVTRRAPAHPTTPPASTPPRHQAADDEYHQYLLSQLQVTQMQKRRTASADRPNVRMP